MSEKIENEMSTRENHDSYRRSRMSEGGRRQRQGNRGDEAPLQQQIAWGRQITGRDATHETILVLFERDGHRFEARNLATALHRVGKFGGRRLTRDPRLKRLVDMCARRIGDFKAQEITNSAWGCAKSGFADQRFFGEIAAEAARQINEFNPQNLANTVWAFATASVVAERLFKAVAAEVSRRINEFKAQEMANTVWAFCLCRLGSVSSL